jgi:hypothetical protein
MSAATHPPRARWRLVLRAALTTVLAAVLAFALPAGTASASGLPAAQTRVGAIHPTVTMVVGVAEHIAAGQHLGRAPSQLRHAVGHCVAAEAGTSGAESAMAGRNLGRQLASEQQLGEAGTAIAGAGTNTVLRGAPRLVDQYGGAAGDWAKMGGSSYRGADGFQFETHWYQNVRTGERFEFKPKITGGGP